MYSKTPKKTFNFFKSKKFSSGSIFLTFHLWILSFFSVDGRSHISICKQINSRFFPIFFSSFLSVSIQNILFHVCVCELWKKMLTHSWMIDWHGCLPYAMSFCVSLNKSSSLKKSLFDWFEFEWFFLELKIYWRTFDGEKNISEQVLMQQFFL